MNNLVNVVKIHLEILGKKPLCNKKPERAPWIFNFCFPLCWRCTSIVIGYILGNIIQFTFLMNKSYFIIGITACIPTFIDYSMQYKGKFESTNSRRIITGLLAGFGISFVQ